MTTAGLDEYIEGFVRELERRESLTAPWLEHAVRGVPRHCFIEQYYGDDDSLITVDPSGATDEQLKLIYSDSCLMIHKPPNHSAASQPSLVMLMLGCLDVQPGQKVLEIGTGSGWNAGLLAYGVRDGRLVHSIDIQADLVEAAGRHLQAAGIGGVNLKAADAGYGWSDAAPFDRIMATVGCPDIPHAWREQLAEGGVMLVPLRTAGIGDPLIRLTKQNGRVVGGFSGWSWFMTLQGEYWTDAEDILQLPFEPWSDSLLEKDPQTVSLREPMTLDCLVFLRLKGLKFQGLRSKDMRILHGGYLHHQSRTVFVPDKDLPQLRIYGAIELAETVASYQAEWIRLGRPRITDYQVEVVDRNTSESGPRAWIDQRQDVCLRLSLDQG